MLFSYQCFCTWRAKKRRRTQNSNAKKLACTPSLPILIELETFPLQCCCTQDQLPPSPVFAPMQWKRAHLLWASILMQCLLLGIWEFSYSSTFADYVYTFIVGFKIAQVLQCIRIRHPCRTIELHRDICTAQRSVSLPGHVFPLLLINPRFSHQRMKHLNHTTCFPACF